MMGEQTNALGSTVDVFRKPISPTRSPMVPVTKVNRCAEGLDPLKQGSSFVLHGHVYLVIEDKSRGRHRIKHLGIVG